MKVKIKRFDRSLPLPSYQSKGAACVDLYARVDVTIAPGQAGYVPLNVALEMPEGGWGPRTGRRSTKRRTGSRSRFGNWAAAARPAPAVAR